MKNNFLKISILSAGFLLLPAFCFGAVSYSRTPAGYNAYSPVVISVSFDDFLEVCPFPSGVYTWQIRIRGLAFYETPIYPATTKNITYSFDLPVGDYDLVIFLCPFDTYGYSLESGSPVFTIGSPPPPPTIPIPANSISSIFQNASELIADLGIFIWLFAGVPLAFYVIWKIQKVMPKK